MLGATKREKKPGATNRALRTELPGEATWNRDGGPGGSTGQAQGAGGSPVRASNSCRRTSKYKGRGLQCPMESGGGRAPSTQQKLQKKPPRKLHEFLAPCFLPLENRVPSSFEGTPSLSHTWIHSHSSHFAGGEAETPKTPQPVNGNMTMGSEVLSSPTLGPAGLMWPHGSRGAHCLSSRRSQDSTDRQKVSWKERRSMPWLVPLLPPGATQDTSPPTSRRSLERRRRSRKSREPLLGGRRWALLSPPCRTRVK